MRGTNDPPHRGLWPLAGLCALFALAAIVSSAPASASSYSGVGDWTIGGTEVVVGETINVSGHVLVLGDLTLVNSTLIVWGRIDAPPTPPPEPPPRESARLNVSGTLTLTNTTVRFFVPFGGPALPGPVAEIAPGFRVFATGHLTVTDFDNDSATPADASVITAFGFPGAPLNGSYSVFSPGSSFTMRNSRAEMVGYKGFPGFEFNTSAVNIAGSLFYLGPTALSINRCNGVILDHVTFDGVGLAVNVTGGSNHRFVGVAVWNYTLGVVLHVVSDTEVTDFRATGSFAQEPFPPWPAIGTSLAAELSTNLTMRDLVVDGNVTAGQSSGVSGFALRFITFSTLDGVSLTNADAVGTISNSSDTHLANLTATGVLGGLSLSGSRFTPVSSYHMSGDSPFGLEVLDSTDIDLSDIIVSATRGLVSRGSSWVTLDSVWLAVTQTGLDFRDGSDLTVGALTVTGVGSGLVIHNTTRATFDQPSLEFARVGVQVTFSAQVTIDRPLLSTPAGIAADTLLVLFQVTDVLITGVDYAGPCAVAGTVDYASRLTLDGFVVQACDSGLAVSGASNLTISDLSIPGAWNGTALGLYNVTDGHVTRALLSMAGAYALGLDGDLRVQLNTVDGQGAAHGGVIIWRCSEVDIQDADFSGAGGVALSVQNSTGPTRLLRIGASTSREGIEVIGSPGVSITDTSVSGNLGEGAYFDPASTGAVLRNLTISGNRFDGLFVGTNGTTLIDGNISANGGEGLVSSPTVRLDWTIEVAGSFLDEGARFTGDLVVNAGASFTMRNAWLRIDEETRQSGPSPIARFDIRGIALFDNATLFPSNSSRPYTVVFAAPSQARITRCDWVGGGRPHSLSAVFADGSLTVDNSTFTEWWRPLASAAPAVEVRDSAFFNNSAGPTFSGARVVLTRVVSEFEDGDGLTIVNAASALITGGRIAHNSGQGVAIGGVLSLTLDGLNLSSNARGAGAITDSELAATGLIVFNNTVGGLSVVGGSLVTFDGLSARNNSGAGVSFTLTETVIVTGALCTMGGGSGLYFDRAAVARVVGGEFSLNGAFGIRADSVSDLRIDGARFDGNTAAHLALRGTTVANVGPSYFANSAGDAVVLWDTARLSIRDAATDNRTARVFAKDSSYAYVLNSSFSTPSSDLLGQVDLAWNLRVVVVTTSGGPGAGALLEVRNVTGDLVAGGTTDASGSSELIPVLERSVFSGGKATIYGPYDVRAQLAGEGRAAASLMVSAYSVLTLRLDAADPALTLTLIGPEGNAGWFLGPATAVLEARDNADLGVAIFWRVDGGAWQTIASTSNFTSTAVSFENEGPFTLEVYAQDGAGNRALTQTRTSGIDLTAPTAAFDALPPTVRASNITLSWSGSDAAGSGIDSYIVHVSRNGGPYEPWLAATNATSAHFEASDGTYSFQLFAQDRAGLHSAPSTVGTELVFRGSLRLAVVDEAGHPLRTALVEVLGTNLTGSGGDELSFKLPAGTYELRVSAPGYSQKILPIEIVAGNLTNLGTVGLSPAKVQATAPGSDPLVLGIVFAAVGGAMVLLLLMRSAKRRRELP